MENVSTPHPQASPSHSTPEPLPFKCTTCDKVFVRREHLVRHMQNHNGEKRFLCSICQKRFSRPDILTRHRLSHQQDTPGLRTFRSRGFRACIECSIRRVGCSGDAPCQRCSEKETECQYPSGRKRKINATGQQKKTDRGPFSSSRDDLSMDVISPESFVLGPDLSCVPPVEQSSMGHRPAPSVYAMPCATNPSPELLQPTGSISDLSPIAAASSHTNDLFIQQSGPVNTAFQDQTFDGFAMKQTPQQQPFSSINWISAGPEQFNDWIAQLSSFTEYPPVEPMYQSGAPLDGTSMQDAIDLWEPQMTQQEYHASLITTSESISNKPKGTEPEHSRFYVDNEGTRPSLQRLRRSRKSKQTTSTSNELMPFFLAQSTENPTARASDINLNEQFLVVAEVYEELVGNISLQNRFNGRIHDQTSFPTLSEVNEMVELFFDNFHTSFPFLRRSCFRRRECDNWILLLAVSSVGSAFPDTLNLRRYRDLLQRLLRDILQHVSDELLSAGQTAHIASPFDSLIVSNQLTLVQARLLNVVNMLHSGKSNLLAYAILEQTRLVKSFNSLQLLVQHMTADLEQTIVDENIWRLDWQAKEAKKRAGYMIWLLDFMITYQSNLRPQLDLADCRASLPCSEDIWDNDLLPALKQTPADSHSLIEALEILYFEKRLVPNVSEFGRVLLIHAICRQTYEVRRNNSNRMSAWTPSPKIQLVSNNRSLESLGINTSRWRDGACDSLDILHWSANSQVAASSGFEHYTILYLHLARLVILTPLEQIQKFISELRIVRSGAVNFRDHLEEALKTTPAGKQVLAWAIRDQYKARLSIIHAGAIFWYIRRYSSDNFIEPFSTYAATLVLWAYSVSVQLSSSAQLDSTSRQAPEMVRDESDPEIAFIQPDRPCDDESVQAYMRFGNKMTAYLTSIGDLCSHGAPTKILSVGIQLLKNESGNKNESPNMEPGMIEAHQERGDDDDAGMTWCIADQYSSLLKAIRDMALP